MFSYFAKIHVFLNAINKLNFPMQIDGRENNKLHSLKFKKFPISAAHFLKEGTQIVAGSLSHAHCFTYDLMSGNTRKTALPHGITNMKVGTKKVLKKQ